MYLQIDSGNSKLVGKPRRGICAALSLPIRQTCSPSCPVQEECYAKGGRVAIKVRRLEEASSEMTPIQIARAASCEIVKAADQHWAEGRPLRLFESGDARTVAAAKEIASAGRYWLKRGGIAVWGYTHSWRNVPRSAWQGISMFASVESVRGAHEAIDHGYTPAMIVDQFMSPRAFEAGGVNFIPCPAQTSDGEIPCVKCRLCFDDEARAQTGSAIAFSAHGQRATRLKRRLNVMRDNERAVYGRARSAKSEASVSNEAKEILCFAPTVECGSVEWHDP